MIGRMVVVGLPFGTNRVMDLFSPGKSASERFGRKESYTT